jgi:hypothetical protein
MNERFFRLRAPVASALAFVTFLAMEVISAWAEFLPPEKLTDSTEKYRLSRTANGHMDFDAAGNLHVTYWSGSELGTTPGLPSHIYYRFRSREGIWSAEQAIDNSTVGSQELHIGGRHPSLAIAPDQTIWIVWGDHRHCTASGNWMDNTEVYADSKRLGASFSEEDIRITTTNAAHLGDNAFAPKVISDREGRLSVCWFDFHFDRDVSDLLLKTSDSLGALDLGETMDSMRITNLADRGNAPGFTVPGLAVDSSGTRYLVWVGGFGAGGNLYYAEAGSAGGTVSERVLATGAVDFFDPPHITIAPNDDVWVVFGDDSVSGGEDVVLLRRRAGEPDFDSPFTVAGGASREYAPDCEIDADGLVHLVWVDERFGTHVYYGVFDTDLPGLIESFPLTETSGPWARPTLALDARGEVYVLWEENTSVSEGDLWFATTAQPIPSSVQGWQLYR